MFRTINGLPKFVFCNRNSTGGPDPGSSQERVRSHGSDSTRDEKPTDTDDKGGIPISIQDTHNGALEELPGQSLATQLRDAWLPEDHPSTVALPPRDDY